MQHTLEDHHEGRIEDRHGRDKKPHLTEYAR